jgi:imidazolonepropionase-like amidohydrolase
MCEIDDRVGSIKVGKDADLVAFKGDILSTQNRPKLIIAGGKTVYRNLIDFN